MRANHHVVQARGGITKVAEKSNKSRSSLYRALSRDGNPHLKSVLDILSAIGMHFSIEKNNNLKHKHA
jgi:probable addiction module antidote protein